ncbi:MAG TPA: deoxyguanosinetriphosphate triphosphohydrolase [Actinomycetes bacterium]|nr:deoxyguanosinetriphosphate triphosphohydrolase [Actinomycetes bacterium]
MSFGAGGYDDNATARFVDEPVKSSHRSAFARDRARVLHSSALRRLAAKTQVVVPWESDFPRTRLTHSLECAQVGRELGQALGCDPDLVETACLAHDLGHPPFGHNGEQALDEVALSCGGFEGNAQSLRILSRLEAKTLQPDGTSAGLNLTRATLDAATKYPWQRRDGSTKFGVYADDLPVFTWLRLGVEGDRRCVEAQVMDWADDVAYSVHDFEDAVHAGHLMLDVLRDRQERDVLVELAADRYAPGVSTEELLAALDRLISLDYWPVGFDDSHRAMAFLKRTTSELIGRFCSAAEIATREAFGGGPLTRYGADLIVPQGVRHECAVLKAITAQYVMLRKGAQENYAKQRDLVTELTHLLLLSSPGSLEPIYADWFKAATTDSERLRVVVDQVAALTDPAAVARHESLLS